MSIVTLFVNIYIHITKAIFQCIHQCRHISKLRWCICRIRTAEKRNRTRHITQLIKRASLPSINQYLMILESQAMVSCGRFSEGTLFITTVPFLHNSRFKERKERERTLKTKRRVWGLFCFYTRFVNKGNLVGKIDNYFKYSRNGATYRI